MPNIIPLIVTAGVMGWMGIAIKPSTVLVFSIALGIAIDVTIRFLVNFKQELEHHESNISDTVRQTINHTGLSIIYTSMILFAGFMIFSFSEFGGTKAPGLVNFTDPGNGDGDKPDHIAGHVVVDGEGFVEESA
ncbi:hypothetical protein MKQ70_29640 [Chitinophaga sedimenti]|uniref:hypothetical protein n=1 Tax=Chitinophaga sedimenti TaxID=2033606 RepID=UPI0020036995|nr:hypothetical protein [Chitinophaga sedimenti]MCK7558919.1 hypothetical protein [Chitinophaga sedimenti]